ncbi:MAG: radical SAM protein, partial [Proteobacteria bacterium]|nr:radical SAM protein [Pseudomonadota bacterium]
MDEDIKTERSRILPSTLRMIAWEITRSCNLACVHCRASALCGPYPGELDTGKCLRLIDEIAQVGTPVIILTGGEPLLRPDIYEIAAYGDSKGLRMVLATNGTFVTDAVAQKLIASGIQRVSVSIDGPDAASHDAFRCVPGAFDAALAGIEAMRRTGLEFQINTTITQKNLAQIREIHDLAHRLGAAAHHIFLLVPTGRGKEMASQAITALEYEETLNWFYEEGLDCGIQLKATCAPHYYRIFHQRRKERPCAPAQVPPAGGGSHPL